VEVNLPDMYIISIHITLATLAKQNLILETLVKIHQ